MRTEKKELLSELESAIRAGGGGALIKAGGAVDQYVLDVGQFPNDLFEAILTQARDPSYQRLQDSLGLLKLFEYNLGVLSEEQKNRLQNILEEIYPRLVDPVTGFLLVELLAKIWGDHRSLSSLVRLRSSEVDNARALVAHGLQWLAEETRVDEIRRRSLEELSAMTNDRAPIVRAEAQEALKRYTASATRTREGA